MRWLINSQLSAANFIFHRLLLSESSLVLTDDTAGLLVKFDWFQVHLWPTRILNLKIVSFGLSSMTLSLSNDLQCWLNERLCIVVTLTFASQNPTTASRQVLLALMWYPVFCFLRSLIVFILCIRCNREMSHMDTHGHALTFFLWYGTSNENQISSGQFPYDLSVEVHSIEVTALLLAPRSMHKAPRIRAFNPYTALSYNAPEVYNDKYIRDTRCRCISCSSTCCCSSFIGSLTDIS